MKASSLALSALLLGALGPVGCGSTDSSEPAATGGASAEGGAGGTGGSTPAGGSGGTGATGGSGGAGGSGATGGSGGSSGDGGTGGTAGSASGCSETIEISLSNMQLLDNDGTYVAYTSVPSPTLGDPKIPDQVMLQFYDDETGSFDLGASPNESFASCLQCLLTREDQDDTAGTWAREYYQSAGSVVVDASTPPISSSSIKATLTDVTLMEATIDWAGAEPSYQTTFVPNGKCLHITSATFDLGCGNGVVDYGEQCDGDELGNASCEALGFTGGSVDCNAHCVLDLGGCTGWTCNAVDLGAFDGTSLAQHGDTCTGTAVYNADGAGDSCTGYDTLGNELVYRLELPAHTSVEVVLAAVYDGAIWVTSSCDDLTGSSCLAGSDALAGSESLSLANTSAELVTYYVVVDGYGLGNCGEFDLFVREPPAVPAEWSCPPALYASYDGCDCQCGAWDPDCDVDGAEVFRCDPGQLCVKPNGTCHTP